MATIFPNGERVLGAPIDLRWAGEQPVAGTIPHSPYVIADGASAEYADLAGGEQFNLSRGSTAQNAVTVTVSAPGGGPGTKTLAEVVADINAVFGVTAGKPTNFAFAWKNRIRLWDKTVGGNVGRIEVDEYLGADEAAKNAVYEKIGLAQFLSRTQGSLYYEPTLGHAVVNDDMAVFSSTYLVLPPETKGVWVEVGAGNYSQGDGPWVPVVSGHFATETFGIPPSPRLMSNLQGQESFRSAVPTSGSLVKVGGFAGVVAYIVKPGEQGIFVPPPGGVLALPNITGKSQIYIPVPKTSATRFYGVAMGAVPDEDASGSADRYAALCSMKAWAVG